MFFITIVLVGGGASAPARFGTGALGTSPPEPGGLEETLAGAGAVVLELLLLLPQALRAVTSTRAATTAAGRGTRMLGLLSGGMWARRRRPAARSGRA